MRATDVLRQTLRGLRRQWQKSPVLAGGMKVYVVVLGLVILFVSGSVTSEIVRRVREAADPPSSSSASSVGSPVTHADETKSSARGSGTSGKDASGKNGSNRATSASDRGKGDKAALSDLEAAAETPSEQATPGPNEEAAVEFLSTHFDASLAPAVSGFRLSGRVDVTDSRVTAAYAGQSGSSCDVLQLLVARAKDDAEADGIARGHSGLYPQRRTTYSWGGRRIAQGMTQEDRPSLFPPAVSFSWVRGNYIVQVTVVPVGPASVRKARDSALRFIGKLRY